MKTVLGFKDFRDQERVIAVVRHHWWVLVSQTALLALFFVLPFFLVPIVFAFVTQAGNAAPQIPGGAVLFAAGAWSLIIWNILFAKWTDYYYDVWIITNWRIIDIDQQGFFKRNVATLLTLDHIEDIETRSAGIIAGLLNFGHVQVQTAAAERDFNIDDVPNPMGVEQMIRAAQEEKTRIFGYQPSPRHQGIYDSEMRSGG